MWFVLPALLFAESPSQAFSDTVTQILEHPEIFEKIDNSGSWKWRNGFIPAGGDIGERKTVTLKEAQDECERMPKCAGITFKRSEGLPGPNDRMSIDFKDFSQVVDNQEWHTYIKPVSKKKAGGEIKNPGAVSSGILYALRSSLALFSQLPSTMAEEKVQSLVEIIDLVKESAVANNRPAMNAAWTKAREHMTSGMTQVAWIPTYMDITAGEEDMTLPTPEKGIGLSFLDGSVDCEERTINLLKDVEMPRVGFGTWYLSGETAYTSVKEALTVGYRHIDTAQAYRNEKEIGRAIKDWLAENPHVKRSDLFIVSKISNTEDFARGKTKARIQAQMDDLGIDYFDLYMIHGPKGGDDVWRNQEAWQDMEDLYEEGKIRALGISNHDHWWLDHLLKYAKHRPVYLQNKFDIYTHGLQSQTGRSMLETCIQEGIVMTGYSTQNAWPGILSPLKDTHVVRIAEEVGKSPSQVLLRWALQLGTAVIPRSSNPDHIRENFDLWSFKLTENQMFRLNRIYGMATAHELPFVDANLSFDSATWKWQ